MTANYAKVRSVAPAGLPPSLRINRDDFLAEGISQWPRLGRGCGTSGAACLVPEFGRIEISDRQNREGQHPLSAGPRAGYRRDWLVVWRLESARAHRGLTELGNADLTDKQIRALRGAISASRRSEKLCPFSATFCRPSAAIVGLNSVLFSDSSSSRERT
jgi:hypothetical protein